MRKLIYSFSMWCKGVSARLAFLAETAEFFLALLRTLL
jgi:hypothetical protein